MAGQAAVPATMRITRCITSHRQACRRLACVARRTLHASTPPCLHAVMPCHAQDGDGVFTRFLPAELLKEVRHWVHAAAMPGCVDR